MAKQHRWRIAVSYDEDEEMVRLIDTGTRPPYSVLFLNVRSAYALAQQIRWAIPSYEFEQFEDQPLEDWEE